MELLRGNHDSRNPHRDVIYCVLHNLEKLRVVLETEESCRYADTLLLTGRWKLEEKETTE
jgi:hypothetical protein